jgi:hypothetical protein
MAATIVTVETALQIVAQLVPLIQSAVATGQPIDAATWAQALSARDAAQAKLDQDIARGKIS